MVSSPGYSSSEPELSQRQPELEANSLQHLVRQLEQPPTHMHFWIDKRSQTCGFSGRHRLPPSFIHTSCRQQRRQRRRSPRGGGGGGGAKLMVTPVHRFQPIENTGLQSGAAGFNRRGVGVGGGGGGGGVAGVHNFHHHQQQHQRHLPPSYVTNLGHARTNGGHSAELDSSVFLDLPHNGNGDHLQTSASQRAATAPPLSVPGALRCGIGAALFVATIFGAVLKLFLFDNRANSALEVMGLFILIVVCLVITCSVSMRRTTTTVPRDWERERDSTSDEPSVQQSQGPSLSPGGQDLVVVIEEPRGVSPVPPGTLGTPAPAELPPPPYHIAILLPNQKLLPLDNDESPPPTYDKAVG